MESAICVGTPASFWIDLVFKGSSHPLHKTIHHPLLARMVKSDGQLVAVHRGDVAIAEFLVKHAGADDDIIPQPAL